MESRARSREFFIRLKLHAVDRFKLHANVVSLCGYKSDHRHKNNPRMIVTISALPCNESADMRQTPFRNTIPDRYNVTALIADPNLCKAFAQNLPHQRTAMGWRS